MISRFFVGLTFLLLTSIPVLAASPPNVVIVITDDQGYGDLSCHGNPVLKTPNLDSLAAESVRLDDYHVAPTCSPTRCAFLTGHWTNRTGVWHTIMGRSMLRENEVTMGQIFKDNGYATGMFGKWHLGDNYPFRPEDRGFTEVMRHGGGGVGQTPDYWDNAYFDGSYFHNSEPEAVEGFCTDVFFRYAKDFIEEQADAGKPFLAYIATNAPHGPYHSPVEYSEPYEDQGVALANFFGMIANIDDNVGQMRKWLEEKGLAENTIFIFTTDNGTSSGAKVYNSEMRGAKGSEYDGGHRVPFFLHWPNGGYSQEKRVGTITAHVDVVPTLIDLCDIDAPTDVKFDGVSIRPLIENENAPTDWPDRLLVTDSQRVKDPIKWRKSAVMSNDWRLVSNHNKKGEVNHELYAIHSDPGQKNNVIENHPEVADRMKTFYEAWWAELEPTFGNPARIKIGHPAENPSRLTSHDWITTRMVPWNQSQVRQGGNHPEDTGFWYLDVVEAGDYEIELRRWPNEGDVAKAAITDSIPPGEPVPGTKAYRTQPGKSVPASTAYIEIQGEKAETKVPEGASSVTLKVSLEKGPAELVARFVGPNSELTGAYYAYVKKL
ncbi:MAG: N-acetylgalactosamine-4-sulfatase [Verrucomicrobiales bacterium]|nr:N-acetylgalactosamine-4-sulfatase [Verrucomicrobiales bacterium]